MKMCIKLYEEHAKVLCLNLGKIALDGQGYVHFSAEAFPKKNVIPVALYKQLCESIKGFGCDLAKIQFDGVFVRFPQTAIIETYPRITLIKENADKPKSMKCTA